MNLYEAVFRRRSIRKYKKEKVPAQLLDKISMFGRRAVPLTEEIKVKIDILDNTEGQIPAKGMWKREAPYYLVCFSEEKPGYEYNAGYLLEQIILYMAAKGLGACYLGGVRAVVPEPEGMRQVLLVAFGYPKGLLYRDPATAKRNSLKELCVFKEEPDEAVKTVLKAARLAPSALNMQPWRFIVYENRIHVFICREFLPSAKMTSMREISVGIMMSHLMLAAEEQWMDVRMESEEAMRRKSYKSGEYVATLYLHRQ